MALARKYINMHTDAGWLFGLDAGAPPSRKKKPEPYDKFHEEAIEKMEKVNDDTQQVSLMNLHIEKIKAVAEKQIEKINKEFSAKIASLSSIRDFEVAGLLKKIEMITDQIKNMRAPAPLADGDNPQIAAPVQEKYEVRLNG